VAWIPGRASKEGCDVISKVDIRVIHSRQKWHFPEAISKVISCNYFLFCNPKSL